MNFKHLAEAKGRCIRCNPEHLTHPKYRADIDGLRAIAVLSVVGFHAFPDWIRGGFIGVDIFFVISGFLISTIIIGSLERDSFSFIEFYIRRIRRIFPALLLVLVSCFAFGWFALLADEYKQLGKHIAGGAGFVSNYLFWNESGYFDNAADTKPLLHLWSLGIEEQYYIVWPLVLWLGWKRRFNLLTITIMVALVSFALNVRKVEGDAVAAFYSPQTRFWELMVGSILAYMTQHKQAAFPKLKQKLSAWLNKVVYAQTPEADGALLRNIASMLGAALIAIGFGVIAKEKFFPGWWALLPTMSAFLIILAGAHAWFNRVILSNRVLVWFGLISFPLYLWHWPLLSFARIVESETPSVELRVALVVASIVLAWLTYILIEKPIRFGKHGKTKAIALLVSMTVVGYVGYNSFKRDGLAFRSGAQLQIENEGDTGHEIFHKYPYQKFYLCTPKEIQEKALIFDGMIRCFKSKQNDPIKIAIIGDSHAEQLFIGLAEALPDVNIVYYVKSSLPYINNKEFEDIFKYVIGEPNIKSIILTSFWSYRFGLSPFWADKLGRAPQVASVREELEKTVSKLTEANKYVYLTDDAPNFSFDPQKCKYSRPFNLINGCGQSKEFFYSQHRSYYSILQSLENSNVKILKTAEYFCDRDYCYMAKDGKLFYRDGNHLNINGSRYLGKKIVEYQPQLKE